MRKLISIAFVLSAAGALAASGSAGTHRHRAEHRSNAAIAAIADASTSWAEFSAKVPNLRDALTG